MRTSSTTSADCASRGNSDSVRKPCAMVVPNGPPAARSRSTWIHWWSPVASANASMRSCDTSIQDEGPNSAPASSSLMAPPYDTRGPGVARAGSEEQHELAVSQLTGAGGAVEREQRVDAAHVTGVVEVGGARRVEAERCDESVVHRRLHVDAAEIADILQLRAAPL